MLSTQKIKQILVTLIIIIFLCPSISYSQNYNKNIFKYISPKPSSINNSPSNNIIIYFDEQLNLGTVYPQSLIKVNGKFSGDISGKIITENKSIIFMPDDDFLLGDDITVDLSGLARLFGDLSATNFITFSVRGYTSKLTDNVLKQIYEENFDALTEPTDSDSLPIDFPEITVEIFDDPADGKLFFGVFGATPKPSILISENSGNPIFYLETNSIATDFKKQPNGLLTYFDSQNKKFYALNNHYELVDSFYCGNGFETDLHELQLLNNGHCYLLGLDPQIIDMSVLVEGGKEDATVKGFVVQELDENKNVVFQWRSLDYISVLDAEEIDFTAQVIDYIHTNSICVDFDGNLIISSRNLNEVTKFNRQTGELIWRLGGKQNQFSFINEEYKFYRQHDARRLQNGNILLFDNGNFHTPRFSRAVEYNLNETTFVATKVWQFRNSPDLYTSAMGNVRRLSNGNTLINWTRGGFITEVRPDGSKALEIKFPPELYSYRVFKSYWETTIFQPQMDSINFGDVSIGETFTKQVVIQSNSEKEITITGIFNSLEEFSTVTAFPILIPSFGEVFIDISFLPSFEGVFSDTLNVRSDSDSSIITSQFFATGTGSIISSTENENQNNFTFNIEQNYPNPFNPSTTINFTIPKPSNAIGMKSQTSLKIYDVLGNEIATLLSKELPAGEYKIIFNADEHPSGVYFYELRTGVFSQTKKMLLLR